MAYEPVAEGNWFPFPHFSDADREDLFLRAILKARGVDMAPYHDIKLSCTGIRGRSNDDSKSFAWEEVGGPKTTRITIVNSPRLDPIRL